MDISFIEIYSDIGAGKHGTTHGVAMLSNHCESTHPTALVHKIYAQHQTNPPAHPCAKYIENLLPFFKDTLVPQVEQCLNHAKQNNLFAVIISGDHSNAIGNLASFMNHHQDKRIGVVWIDAHADLHSVFTTPSGNMHGMPLATALRLDNLACQVNTPNDSTQHQWQQLKHLSAHTGLLPNDVFFLGLRSFEPPEEYLINQHNIFAYSAQGEHIGNPNHHRSLDDILDDLIHSLQQLDVVYISFDVDALDGSLIPATGTPEPNGYHYDDLINIFERLLPLPNVQLFEITEFNPTLDNDSDKHKTIFKLLNHALGLLEQR